MQEGNCVNVHKLETAIKVGQEVMLPVVAAHAWMTEDGERQHVYSMSGPCRWPLLEPVEKRMQKILPGAGGGVAGGSPHGRQSGEHPSGAIGADARAG